MTAIAIAVATSLASMVGLSFVIVYLAVTKMLEVIKRNK